MQIYDSNDTLLLDVEVDDNSCRNRSIMGNDTLTLYFSLAEHAEIPIGAYCEYQGSRYTLERPENLKMQHTRLFEYVVTMEAYQSRAKHWKFKNTVDGRLKFPLTAKPHEHLQMFIDNMNLRDSGWTMGECVPGTEHLISYDHNYCIDALQMMANEFDTEWEIVNKRVSLKKVEYNKATPLALAYGKGNGFKPGVGRSNSSDQMPVEILYVQGGDRNIDPSVYGFKELHLPPVGSSLGFDGTFFEDETGYDSTIARQYEVRSDRMSIQRSDRPLDTYAEDSIDCSDIYPKRIGQVDSVIVVSAENHYYDIIDSETLVIDGVTHPNPCPNYSQCIIVGEKMTIVFQSGMLAGREFDVSYHDEDKRFAIVPCELDGRKMPDSVFSPVGGDTFIIFNCTLPASYICDNATKTGAEWDMFRAAIRYLYEHEDQRFTFTGDLDGIWSKSRWENVGPMILLGGYVSFQDDRFQSDAVLVRITAIKDYINNPYSPEITLSNQLTAAGFASSMNLVQNQEVEMGTLYNDSILFTKRRFRDALDTMEMLQESLLDFAEGINPITVQTMQALIGDKGLQFEFRNGNDVVLSSSSIFHMNNSTRVFSATNPGTHPDVLLLVHTELDMEIHGYPPDYLKWIMSDFISQPLTDDTQGYYLYAKCSSAEGVETGEFVLSPTAIKIDDVAGYYHFLVGILGKAHDGERSFVTLYGFTELLPGRVTTNLIISNDGHSFFNLQTGRIEAINALIRGTYRSPFQNGDSNQFSSMSFDNVITSSGHTINLVWDPEQSGRKILICGSGRIAAPPSGQYIYINGSRRTTYLDYSNEILSLVGYGTDNVFYGWVVVDRDAFYGNPESYGNNLRALMIGNVKLVKDDGKTFAVLYGSVFDDEANVSFDIGPTIGSYVLIVPASWFKRSSIGMNGVYQPILETVLLIGSSDAEGVTVHTISKTYDQNNDAIRITIRTDMISGATPVWSIFSFILLNSNQWQNSRQVGKFLIPS